ncbi:uncharacterized protein [Nicotiana tomentosiformis]|uniref:uncharacterized protein n=1 Tax=Nicotiana tomentosiformis TaxID=4098 RepID=UPI000878B9E6|nr:uncharacterized protein LOC104089040 isoform X2 [Nicotiana tomentosiformis]
MEIDYSLKSALSELLALLQMEDSFWNHLKQGLRTNAANFCGAIMLFPSWLQYMVRIIHQLKSGAYRILVVVLYHIGDFNQAIQRERNQRDLDGTKKNFVYLKNSLSSLITSWCTHRIL